MAAPPKLPECRSRLGPVMTSSAAARPRSCVEMAGVSLSHCPVSHTSARSAVTSLPCLARKPGSDGDPHSSSPSISTLMRIGQSAGHALPGPDGFQEGHELAFVVLRAASDDHLAVGLVGGDAWLERRRFPLLERVRRLHVVVAVEQHVRAAVHGRLLIVRNHHRMPGGGHDLGVEVQISSKSWRTTPRPSGIAACRQDRSIRWECGSGRTAGPGPDHASHPALSGLSADERSWVTLATGGTAKSGGRIEVCPDASVNRARARCLCGIARKHGTRVPLDIRPSRLCEPSKA